MARWGIAIAGLLAACGANGPPDGGALDAEAVAEDSGAIADAGAPDAGKQDTGFVPLAEITIDDYPRVDGSTSNLPLARVIACELLGLGYRWVPWAGEEGEAIIVPVARSPAEEPLARAIIERIVHNKTHQAYVNLVDGMADLILVANRPSPEEASYASSKGVTLELRPLALDALVILVNATNPVTDLDQAEVRGIFMGQVTRWAEVGGGDGAIQPYVRPANSGSQQLMETIAMNGLHMPAWPPDRTIAFMGALVDEITRDPLSIGFSVYYWVTFQYPVIGFRVLSIGGVAPTAATIGARTYPYVAEVFVATRAGLDPRSLAAQLRDWLLTPAGQAVVARSGYVSLAP